MRDILLVSQLFYPGGVSLLIWLSALAVLAHAVVAGCWLLVDGGRKGLSHTAFVLGCCGALVSLAMVAVEAVVFEFADWLCVAAYCVLLCSFAWVVRESRITGRHARQVGASVLAATAALSYLFPFGGIPHIVELNPKALSRLEGTNVLGGMPGALLITEFADFECPPCAAQDRVMEKLWEEFPDRVRYNFRHLPLRKIHPHAQGAALASQCAAQQGRFWETKRLLFANQDRLEDLLSRPVLPSIPTAGIPEYMQCMQSRAALPELVSDLEQAQHLRLHGTPAIVVGNKLIAGSIRYPRLEVIVRHELGNSLSGTEAARVKAKSTCTASPAGGACAE